MIGDALIAMYLNWKHNKIQRSLRTTVGRLYEVREFVAKIITMKTPITKSTQKGGSAISETKNEYLSWEYHFRSRGLDDPLNPSLHSSQSRGNR